MGQGKERLFEVMGRLDKTFKPKLNEEIEIVGATDDNEVPAEIGGEEIGGEEMPVEEKSVEEKYEELKEKVEELYGLINGEEPEEGGEEEMAAGIEAEPENGEEVEAEIELEEGEKKEE